MSRRQTMILTVTMAAAIVLAAAAAYTVGVLTSLLLAGHISDLVGRRKVLLAALGLELAAAMCSSPSRRWRCCSWPG